MEKEAVTHSSILAWRIPRAEGPGGVHPRGHKESDMTESEHIPRGHKESDMTESEHSPRGHKESDMTESEHICKHSGLLRDPWSPLEGELPAG